MAFNEIEQEAIILNAIWDMIDEMVNFAIFTRLGSKIHDTNLLPNTLDTRRLFHVLLVDFLSPLSPSRSAATKGQLPFNLPPPPSNARSSDLTFLFYLRQVCDNSALGPERPELRAAMTDFANWLEADSFVPNVWFPSIEMKADLTIERKTWIKLCGDIGKHNFARLEGNVSKIVAILGEHGHLIDEGMGYLVLPAFWDWFHTHLFAYHASTIAEFLNNIRWAIFRYLKPEFERSYRRLDDDGMYEYRYPDGIAHPLARSMYWDLMNRCRDKPFFPQFSVTKHLKAEY